MPIDSLLEELVSRVEGATGAIILAADGEAVQWYGLGDGDRLRLRGAYISLVLHGCRESAARLGGFDCLVLEYKDSSFVAQELDGDCFIVLELRSSANISQAMFRLKPIVAKLRHEIAV